MPRKFYYACYVTAVLMLNFVNVDVSSILANNDLNEELPLIERSSRSIDFLNNTAPSIKLTTSNITGNSGRPNVNLIRFFKKDNQLGKNVSSQNTSTKRKEEGTHIHVFVENPCQNGAPLALTPLGSHCVCKPGYKGTYCQDKDQCFQRPCRNKAICIDLKTRYECQCKSGYRGLNCEIRDKCLPNPCMNNGICREQNGKIQCSCQRGFKGKLCKEINNCETNPCKNGGTCSQLNGTKFTCVCMPQFTGTICQNRKRCLVNPCRNGGLCVEDETKPICSCQEGYVAEYCQDHVCLPNPCMHGGACKAINKLGWTFNCTCPKMYKGTKCEVPHPCITKPCLHGRCVEGTNPPRNRQFFGSYTCVCHKGYTGKHCRTKTCDKCDKNAKCVSGQCVCNNGYRGNGLACQYFYIPGPCSTNPCLNSGTCIELDSKSYDCRCTQKYAGNNCEKRLNCIPNPCKNGGACFENGQTFRCVCPKKFTGKTCSNAVLIQDKCNPNPCKFGGICKTSEDGSRAFCQCPTYKFKAPYCECSCPKANILKERNSKDSFCNMKGDCLCPQKNMYLTPWGCVSAAVMDNPCSSSPCLNQATCYNATTTPIVNYGCRCPPGFIGSRCEIKLPNPCLPNPCKNNGTCIRSSKGIAICTCKPGFVPPYCDGPKLGVSKCFPNPCSHGGKCIERNGSYDCKCVHGFRGTHCHVTIDDCNGCYSNTSVCFRGKCICRPGFAGNGKYCVPLLHGSRHGVHHKMNIVKRFRISRKEDAKEAKSQTEIGRLVF